MTEIREAAKQLTTPEKAELAAFLLGSMESSSQWVDDAEVARRSAEMDSGEVVGISREEFSRQCGH